MGKYQIIYADPPWEFKVWSKKGEGRSADVHYKTMTTQDIQLLPVDKISDTNSVLLMWATYPCLIQALELGKYWGFEYKTVAFTWVKKNKHNHDFVMSMGYYTRSNAEICLLFTKGKPLNRKSKGVRQIIFESDEVIITPLGKHSQKPDEARKRIVELFGDVPRIELFARERSGMFGMDEYKGWDVFGNQISNSINI